MEYIGDAVYEGEFDHDLRHGLGRFAYDGVIYEGSWSEGVRHGAGVELRKAYVPVSNKEPGYMQNSSMDAGRGDGAVGEYYPGEDASSWRGGQGGQYAGYNNSNNDYNNSSYESYYDTREAANSLPDSQISASLSLNDSVSTLIKRSKGLTREELPIAFVQYERGARVSIKRFDPERADMVEIMQRVRERVLRARDAAVQAHRGDIGM